MMKQNISFIKDRDEALFSLDEQKIRCFCRKYNVQISDNPVVFWASVYKSILAMKNSPAEAREKAGEWLDSHGFHREINYIPEEKVQQRFPRHTFEHVIFPEDFYRWGDKILNQVIDGDRYYMADFTDMLKVTAMLYVRIKQSSLR